MALTFLMRPLKLGLSTIAILVLALFIFGPGLLDRSLNRTTGARLASVPDSVRTFHTSLWVADLHCDALLWNRNLLQKQTRGHVDLPRMQQGNLALQVFTIVSKTPFGLNFERNSDDSDMITAAAIVQRWPANTWFSLRQRALYQAGKLRKFAANSHGALVLLESQQDLRTFSQQRAQKEPVVAALLAIEGAQVLEGEIANIQVLFDAGFRMMAPTHFFDTDMAGSAHGVSKGGLTNLGKKMVYEMERLGMILDLAHASPKTIDDVLKIATRPVLVSHTGVKGTCDNLRNLSDEQVAGIAATGGVVGIAFFSQATCGKDLEAVTTAIRYTADLVGVGHVALGSDFDGAVATPIDAAAMPLLTAALTRAGFTRSEIALIMGENVRRLLMQLLP